MEAPFGKYKRTDFSQNGEDGIIEELFSRIKCGARLSQWCVEFGAWDGRYMSNTFALVKQGWNAVYIEGDEQKYGELQVTARQFPSIVAIHAMIERDPKHWNSLDSILASTLLPQEYDLLSIDVDSNDLEIWESHQRSPKVVVIEINSSAPPGVFWRHSITHQGNTFSETLAVAEKKQYSLVCHTGNLVFVRNDLIGTLNVDSEFIRQPDLLRCPHFLYQGV